jgi:type IV pilus assembly protein PilY1
MSSFVRRFRHVATGALLATFVSLPVVAEDSEIYVNAGTGQDAQPNVLFVIDSSESMEDPVSSTGLSRLETVKQVAISLTQQLKGVNLGVMQYNSNSEGGFVMQPVADLGNATHREAVVDSIGDLTLASIQGTFTPLSETYYEAFLYFTGGKVDYGTNSINTARQADQSFYKSPISHQCQKNYIVYLTDGIPTRDIGANTEARIQGLLPPNACPLGDDDDTEDPANGACADELAAYMSDEDRDLMTGVAGNQNILTYMIGFGGDVTPSPGFDIDDVAAAGGTDRSFTALDGPSLMTTLQEIFRDLQTDRGTFVTPAVSVDAFNRAQTANELFFSLFKATGRTHWAGNLKKYGISNTGQIIDETGTPAVAGGFFATGSKSIWSDTADEGDVEAGGAASHIKQPSARKIYTSIAGGNLLDPDNALVPPAADDTEPAFTDLLVGTGANGAECSDACREAILWARGDDVSTAAGGDFVRKIGDPLHGQPAVVTYGNYDPTDDEAEPDTYVFMPTNDGMLHAFDGRDSADGDELWAYIPPELLNRLGPLRTNGFTATRTFGLDGDVRVLKLDKNGNGVIDYDADDAGASDRVWLFFGMRSGGNRYYALDVTVPTAPKLMWNIGPETLPGIGLTWSPPVVARVNVGGTSGNDDDEKVVLIFGGGYDYTQETQTYATDPTGNRIFMVDASTGRRLWYAGGGFDAETPPDPAPDLPLIKAGRSMDNAIPGRITVLDHNGDGFADRMYAGDMGGRIWRLDILNGAEPSLLVRGGIFAALGNGSVSGGTALTNRRFYNAPDVALVRSRGEPSYYNIAIGSGYRGHPLNRTTVERFYSLRDMDPFSVPTQDTYDTRAFIVDDDTLFDVSLDPAGSTVNSESKGWKYTLKRNGDGEKVLAEATTVDGVILFPTYEPVDPNAENPCAPTSINRVYALTAFAGKPAINFNTVGTANQPLNNADVFTNLGQQGIVGAINVALLRGNDDTGGTAPRTVCLAGVEVLSRCVDIGGTVRTYWQRNDVP